MTAIEFLNKLMSQIPSEDLVKRKKVSEEVMKREVASLLDLAIKSPSALTGDIVLDLLSSYDLSKVEIGMLTFNGDVTEDASYYYIGNVEVDLLVKNKQTGVIQLLEYDQPLHVLSECAQDSESFLKAILICNAFFWECLLDDAVFNDEGKRAAVIEECTYMAGGDPYYGFYAMLAG